MLRQCAIYAVLFGITLPASADVLSDQWDNAMRLGGIASEQDDSAAEVPHYREALKIAEHFGETDTRLMLTLSKLAVSCHDDENCQAGEAERHMARALQIRKRVTPKNGA